MMKLHRILICCAVTWLMSVSVSPLAADLGVGPRAIGMGGAFTAIADDANATYWNPAGLAKITRFTFQPPNVQARIETQLGWRDVVKNPPTGDADRIKLLNSMGSSTSTVNFSANMAIAAPRFAVFVQPQVEAKLDAEGVTLDPISGDPEEGGTANVSGIGYVTAGVSVARAMKDGSFIGVTVKSVMAKGISEGYKVNALGEFESTGKTEPEDSGLGVDVGYLKEVSPGTSVGVMLRNLLKPSLGDMSPNSEINVGVARKVMKGRVLLAADIQSVLDHPTLNLGAELKAGKILRLWGGVYHQKATLGLGLSILGAKIQVAYSPENNSLAAASVSF